MKSQFFVARRPEICFIRIVFVICGRKMQKFQMFRVLTFDTDISIILSKVKVYRKR